MNRKHKLNKLRYLFGTIVGLFILIYILFSIFVVPKINMFISTMPKRIEKQVTERKSIYIKNNAISKYIKEAVIASQDERFYSNLGVDSIGTFRAIYFTIFSKQRQGASTITEQLIKNVYYNDQDTLRTDIETKILALFVTFYYSKDQILEMYLNDIYYGKGAYGIYEASKVYFNTTPNNVTIYQAAYLIGLINAPSYYALHPKQATEEERIVLSEMIRNHFIKPSEVKIY